MEQVKRKRIATKFFFGLRGTHWIPIFLLLLVVFFSVPGHIVHAWDILDSAAEGLNNLVKALLYAIFWLFSLFVTLAAALFVWVLDTKTFSALMNQGGIYTVWQTVRDFCNIFFILVLLFSAFATIFQLDKYEWKKTVPMLIIMALLVNFSFPVSRFVIDLANVPMYFFAQNAVGGSGTISSLSEGILSASNIRNIILPNSESESSSVTQFNTIHLLVAVICMFLFGVSFLVLAVLMLIRMIALAILVMFSPIGFAGMITPALHKFASDWWNKLFKWSFYGPISVMMVLVAVIVMKAAGEIYGSTMKMQNVTAASVSNTTFLSGVAFLTIPIVLFWIAITSAEKYSNDMSGLGIKFGSQMGRWMGRAPSRLVGASIRQTGIPGGIQQAWKDRRSWILGGSESREAREKREAMQAGLWGGGLRGREAARQGIVRKRVQEAVERNKKLNRTDLDIHGDLMNNEKGDAGEIRRRAAALTMADRESFSNSEEFARALSVVGDDMESISKIIRKAPKDIMKSGEDFAKALSTVAESGISPSALSQAKNQLIEKAGGNALSIKEGEMERIMKSLAHGTNDNGEEFIKTLKSRLKKEGKIKSLIDYEVKKEMDKPENAGADEAKKREITFNAYDSILKDYNAENLGNQAKLMDDDNFRAFFKRKTENGDYKARFLNDYLRRAEGDRRSFEEFVKGKKTTDEEDIIAGGGMPA